MTPGFSWLPVVASCLVSFGLPGAAAAQVRLSLSGGFTPDPMEITLTASGDLAADAAVRGCSGFVAEAPALVIDYTSPGVPLRLGVGAEAGLAGVVVVAPDGISRCANVDAEGRASLRIDPALSGEHTVWPALTIAGAAVSVRIFATERDATPALQSTQNLVVDAEPAFGTHSPSGDGGAEVDLTLAPTTAASDVESACSGRIDPSRPDALILLEEGANRLQIRASSDTDTTLVVSAPDGTISCNDDTNGLDPALTFSPASDGRYAVWVGTYGDVGGASARLLFSVASDAFGLRTTTEPAWGTHILPDAGSVDIALDLAGAASASDFSTNCWGHIEPSRPDAVIQLQAEEGQLQLRATSATDTTLVVVAPDGTFSCNDDSSGLDPAVTIRQAAPGDYAVWVGTFGGGSDAATLTATAGARPSTVAPGETLVFTGAPLQTLLDIMPSSSASELGPDCYGEVNADGPDAIIRVADDRERLVFGASSPDEDTTLVVLATGGTTHCDDDTHGLDPEVVLAPAPAGDYAVWVGTYGGEQTTATLRVGAEGASGSTGGFSPADASPFLGRPLSSATEALDILLGEMGLSGFLAYDAIEPQGIEGFTLSGVVATDPTGESPPLRMDRLSIADLDLEGLTATGAPGRFSLAMEGIDYMTFVAALVEEGTIPPLPPVEGTPSLDIRASMLPADGDPTRRVVTSEIAIEGAFTLAMEARMRWHDGVGVPDDVADLPTESMAIEVRNYGYFGDLLRAQASEAGMETAAMTRLLTDSLGVLLAPIEPGGPRDQALGTLRTALADLDQAGVLRISISTEAPQGLDALMSEFEGGAILDNPALEFDVTFTPLD